MLQCVYPNATWGSELQAPESARIRSWEREEAVRELVRGRLEVCGPVTADRLADWFGLDPGDIDAALLALEAEGFILRGRFQPGTKESEWCDRRLLARIHRLTIHRLRAEIQPVSVQDFLRFLLAWQKVDPDHRVEGPHGLDAVLEVLDGFEAPVSAWEPDLLTARMSDYDPEWLNRICLSGRAGWGRVSPPRNLKARPFAPLRSSPIGIFQRGNLLHWLRLAESPERCELAPESKSLLELIRASGASFFADLVQRSGLFPSQVEQALSELAALGLVTADSFDGLRALLIPSAQRPTFGREHAGSRRRRDLASIEFAGRWSILRPQSDAPPAGADARIRRRPDRPSAHDPLSRQREEQRRLAMEAYAKVLLRRYGIVFRRLLDREPFGVSWYELGRVFRSWEARGQIRGGHFVSGVSGEQFALPEAIGLMRSIRKQAPRDRLVSVSGADPLNLAGIVTPGGRVASVGANRVLFRDGLPVARLEAGEILSLATGTGPIDSTIERALRVGKMQPALRPYYR